MIVYRRHLQNIRSCIAPVVLVVFALGSATQATADRWWISLVVAIVTLPLGAALVARCLLMGLYLDVDEGHVHLRKFWRTRVLNTNDVTAVLVDDAILPLGGSYCPAFYVNGRVRAATCLVARRRWATRETAEIAGRLGKPVIDASSLDDWG
jgi:hypothetical protein